MAPKAFNYFNRELSWLEFNQRVLNEAQDQKLPLLERLNFLAITASNLDEFFMVRVGGLQMISEQGSAKPDPAGMTAQQQLAAISHRTHKMTADQYQCLLEDIEPALLAENIRKVHPSQLTETQSRFVDEVFESSIFPVLTPIAVHSSETFPGLINQTLSLAVRLAPNELVESESDPVDRFAVIPFGRMETRFTTLPSDGGYEFLLIEELVQSNVQRFFPGEQILECHPFRITRNADISVDDDRNTDLLEQMKKILGARRESDYVRIEISDQASPAFLEILQNLLAVRNEDVYSSPGPLDLTAFRQLIDLQGFDHLRYDPWPPQPSVDVDTGKNLFVQIARESILLFHPYDSFEPVVRLINEAADDPDVLAIKQTLYRTSKNSPIIAALKRAAERGKYVTVIVELKARFDEARNIEWAREMEAAGVQVIYGVKGLKTHSKICLIIRRESHGIQRYVHFGTGNYNESTAKIYSDVSYLTADEELSSDAVSFFNAVTGFSQPQNFRKIEAAPLGLRERLLRLIASETRRKKQDQDATIMAKLNSLSDPELIDALYEASQAGVSIDLNIRGICCLKPGVPGLSDNIRVVSIIDRYLEHARILYFHHGGENLVFISSADWMPRNLDRRVELLVPVEEMKHRQRLIEILELSFRDTIKCSELQEDGSYERIRPVGRRKKLRYQEELNQQARAAVQQAEKSKPTVFEPYRAPTNDD